MPCRIRIALHIALAVAAAVTAVARAAHGQELAPPRLTTFVPAPLPEAAQAQPPREAVGVELELTIDAAGKVTDVRVASGAGGGYDEAAAAAARQFVFEPARRGGQAIPARIKYRYVFEPPPPPAPTTGTLEGRVLLRGGDVPMGGVVVTLTGPDGQAASTAVTDETGAFSFAELAPGRYAIKLAGPELRAFAASEEITAGELTSVKYRIEAAAPTAPEQGKTLEFGATATIAAPPREVTKRTLQAEELMKMAGTRGDPLRAIEYMPGVARSPQGDFVIIRGASPADSEVQFEGAHVFRLYHFGGLTSFVQPRLVSRIDLYPGNFSARYGRRMGGIVDVGVRDPRTDGFHGMADVNLLDASMLAEGPISKRWSFAVAAKRSYMDFFIDKLVPKDEVTLVAAPVYWDYQAMVVYRPSDADRVRLMVYGSYDDLRLILANPASGDPSIRGSLASYSRFHRGQLMWQHKYNDAVEHEISLGAGPFAFGQRVGPSLAIDVPGYTGFLRAEWRARVDQRLRLIGGLDLTDMWGHGRYSGPAIKQLDGDPETFGPLTGRETLVFDRTKNFFRPAAYAEAIWQPVDRLTLVPGARVDYIGDIKRWTFDPRLTARLQVTKTTTIKGGAGLFSQAPDFVEVLPVVGNPNLRAPRAQHYSLGVEQQAGERLLLTAEGFTKRLSLLVVNSPVPGENLNNDGIGRIYGAEASARLRPTPKSSGFLSYTLSRSERNDHGTEWRPFNWDQTHILTMAGSYGLGRGWVLSSTFRYVTGNPFTPVVGSVYNANTDTYRPVYGAINSQRSNAFHRLDVRIEKGWRIKSGSIAAYLDVQNAYNHQPDEGRAYNYDFTQSQTIPGLPILPSIGVRGEL
jgi:TonB family protein